MPAPEIFGPADHRVFALPPGANFARELIVGLRTRLGNAPPEAIARCEIIVNTARMRRRLRDCFAGGPASFLPRISLLTEVAADPLNELPPAIPPLRRRLELSQLVAKLVEMSPGVAPRSAIFDLTRSLDELFAEMQIEGVSADVLAELDVADQSGHWRRAIEFLRIAQSATETATDPGAELDEAGRQRLAVERLIARWRDAPAAHPVILAGSTGSRGATSLLMLAVAGLPQGALVLPGFDFAMSERIWGELTGGRGDEDHPQYRFASLLNSLGRSPAEVGRWTAADPAPRRNALISLALRPAPVTDQWLAEGPDLGDLREATAGLSLMEAPDVRTEALAIALRLRDAALSGRRAALVTPDRTLTRQVTAALDRWGIEPDDSAGRPLALSAPGRLLRQVVALMGGSVTPEDLLALLKHPLVAAGGLEVARLEHWMRQKGAPFIGAPELLDWAGDDDDLTAWAHWLQGAIGPLQDPRPAPLVTLVDRHLKATEALAAGPGGTGTGGLWDMAAGEAASEVAGTLKAEAPHGGEMTARDYAALLDDLLNAAEVRDPIRPHPDILIWGTLEARAQSADVVILSGLSDGVWPEMPGADPWLNRALRAQAGLLLPERRIGLSAHDFQQAAAAPEVLLTRSLRDAEAETVVSRWLNRLVNLMSGLPATHGPEALERMRSRGARWLAMAHELDGLRVRAPKAPRPAPAPPVALRPAQLSVTEVQTLVRDPYAIYAKHVLGLRPLDPIRAEPDARLRGIALHTIFERFLALDTPPDRAGAAEALRRIAGEVLGQEVPWPTARQIWFARIARIADWFVLGEADRRREAAPMRPEARGSLTLPSGFKIFGQADRIDRRPDGSLRVIDYKTGAPPSPLQILHYDRQLLLEAAMAEAGGFEGIPAGRVTDILHIGLGRTPKDDPHPLRQSFTTGRQKVEVTFDPAETVAALERLLAAYGTAAKGYTSRRANPSGGWSGDYDQLARYGEWTDTDDPVTERLE